MWDIVSKSFDVVFFIIVMSAVFYLGLCTAMATKAGMPDYIKDRVYQVRTFWVLFTGSALWTMVSLIGYFRGLPGIWLCVLVAVVMGQQALSFNKDIKKMPKK